MTATRRFPIPYLILIFVSGAGALGASADSGAPVAASDSSRMADSQSSDELAQSKAVDSDSGWQLVDDDDGIKVYKKEIPGSSLIAFKGEGMIEAPLPKVAGAVLDNSRATEWVSDLAEARTLHDISHLERIEYNHVRTPFILKDRDFVSLFRAYPDVKTKTVALRFHSIDDAEAPRTDYVRGKLINSAFILKYVSPAKTDMIAQIHCDPKGSVPKWIVNLFQRGWPKDTIEGVRKQVKKPDVQEDLYYKKLFGL